MTQEIQTSDSPATAPQSDAPKTYSSDAEGVRAAASALLKKRGLTETADTDIGDGAETKAPTDPKDGISARQAADKVSEWRKARQLKREQFEAAVFGNETPSDEDAARFDAITKPDELAAELHKSASAEAAKVEAAIQAERNDAPPPAPMSALDQQFQNYIAGEVEKARQQVVNSILTNYPEAHDQETLNLTRETDPQRYAEIAAAYAQGEQALKLVQNAAQLEAVKAHSAVQSQFNQWAVQEDAAFAAAHPELRDPKVRAEVFENVMSYLRSRGMSDQDIAASWNGTGPINLRHRAAQETLLKAARYDAMKKNLETRPRPRTVPKVMRSGVAGDVAPRNKFADLEKNFERTGSARDAGRLIAARRAEAARRGRR